MINRYDMDKSPVRSITVHGIMLEMTFWLGYCAFSAFSITTLVGAGWMRSKAAALITAMAVLTVIIQPIYGYVSDKLISEKKLAIIMIIGAAIFIGVLPISLNFGNSVLIILNFIGITIFGSSINGMLDAWLVSLKQQYHNINYGLIRGCGSMAYAISARMVGEITLIFGHNTQFYFSAAALALAAVSAITLQAAKKNKPPKTTEEKLPEQKSGNSPFQTIFSSKKYCFTVCIGFLLMLSNSPQPTLLQLVIPDLGGNISQIGTATAIMAISEVPCMFFILLLVRKIDEKYLMAFACAMYIIRMIISGSTNSLTVLLVTQAMHGLTFAVFQPTAISYLSKICEKKTRSTAVNTYTAISSSFSSICGNGIITAILASGFMAQTAFYVFTIPVILGTLVSVYGIAKKTW